ncbi:diaminopimelate dehydrogenase [uncultured Porphyromonas sp.]|uniref:diaminopimelate dehydrogenase n=1 Tax=uncultured Porphyromonas sp. TaxID=159274 RepID=UPI002608C97D|nr:diaminopimelate dehydrogenase [uncultured Porphyromonas sp.]
MSETKKIRAAVVGYGNIGHYAIQALEAAPDFEIAGVVRRDPSNVPYELRPYRVVGSIKELDEVDVALLCTPTRLVEVTAQEILALGIHTVDSFDIHTMILPLREALGKTAREHGAVSVIAAGWDPGSDSVVRTLMEAIVPKGITYTNFGPGMSMGHTVAVKAIAGVHRALSMTIPTGTGIHRRMVYIELEPGYKAEEVIQAIKTDDYFAHDETHVTVVDDVDQLIDMGHGVHMTRKGVSGQTQNQLLEFNMKINNPALTAQILVAAARATRRLTPGCYTMQEIPVIDLLPGEREQWIGKLC